MISLRSYQRDILDKVANGIDNGINVLFQADTGAGKTRIISSIAIKYSSVYVVAHRNLLVKQLSDSLNSDGVDHQIIGGKHLSTKCKSSKNDTGVYICSIQTLLNKIKSKSVIPSSRSVFIVDEAHHIINTNSYGDLKKYGIIIGSTATPKRLDGTPLVGEEGVFDILVQSDELEKDSVKKLISKGYLSDFVYYSIESRLDNKKLKRGRKDYTVRSLESSLEDSEIEIYGDIIDNYKQKALNKQAMVFCPSIRIAERIAERFRESGVSSSVIHSKLGQSECSYRFNAYRSGGFSVLCNVDMIGEGIDIPNVECLIMARKTASVSLFRQWCGRVLRASKGKGRAVILDHVGNHEEHGMPDKHIDWKSELDLNHNVTVCHECRCCYFATLKACPECGCKNEILFNAGSEKIPTKILKTIDASLIEIKRAEIRKEEKDKELSLSLVIPPFDSMVLSVVTWFCDSLNDIDLLTLNNALSAVYSKKGSMFWVERFTLADTNKTNKSKCLRVLNEINSFK